MSNQDFLSSAPKLNAPRSSWKQHFTKNTSWKHGDLIPIDCFEIVPGDTFKLDLKSLIQMDTPLVPILDSIECEINAFFVPMRLVWNNTETFYGANKNSAGAPVSAPYFPRNSIYSGIPWDSVAAYLGKPVTATDNSKTTQGLVSVLKERCYALIWSEFYRATMIQNPFIVSTAGIGGDSIGSLNGTYYTLANFKPLKVNKNLDYFTACLTNPQYGSVGVTLPLGTSAPLRVSNLASTVVGSGSTLTIQNATPIAPLQTGSLASSLGAYPAELFADLSQATAATINDLRNAIATQRFLEVANFGGSLFWGQLAAHYGVTPADASLSRPQRLGSCVFNININQVTAMADTTFDGAVKPAGTTGAVSVTGNQCHLFTKAFTEPGYVMILLHTRQHVQTYSQGLLREDTKFNRAEFYSPEFANLGDQAVLNKEIFVQGTAQDNSVFGYQEHWAEYHYRPNMNSGVLNPNAGAGVALDYWTLANKFANLPSLNSSFLEESRANVARCLLNGGAGVYDYLASFYFDYTAVREMPVVTRPGIDLKF